MKIASISIADYCEAVEGMPHDVERLFFRMILKMSSREAGLPDDDGDNTRMFGYRDIRTYKHLKKQLLAWPNAIRVVGDVLVNDRVLAAAADIAERRAEAVENGRKGGLTKSAKAKIGKASTGDRSEIDRRSVGDRPEIGATSAVDLHDETAKINNLALPSPSPSPSPNKTVSQTRMRAGRRTGGIDPWAMPNSDHIADDNVALLNEAAAELKAAFNGQTESVLADLRRWLGPVATRGQAVQWLSTTLAAYGREPTMQAYAMIIAKQAGNDIVANPLPFWSKTAGTLKAKMPAPKPERSLRDSIPAHCLNVQPLLLNGDRP